MPQALGTQAPNRAPVLTKALVNTLRLMGLSGREAGRIIGVSESSISRMRNGEMVLDESTKAFELAALVVRAFRSLDAITGGDESSTRGWLRAPNSALGATPLERMTTIGGLVDVVAYLDARRAPL